MQLGFLKIFFLILAMSFDMGCATSEDQKKSNAVDLPFVKNSPDECYYLDEFMPVPDNLVSGKSNHLQLRYYVYKDANYKDWIDRQVILSFYSQDSNCWTLYEEYYVD